MIAKPTRLLLVLALVAVWWSSALASPPAAWNLNGELRTTEGDPFSGDTVITVSLWDDPTASSAEHALWTATFDATVVAGSFSVPIGGDDANPLPLDVLAGVDLFVGVAVAEDSEMTPRIQVASVPYAMAAGDADTLGGLTIDDFAAFDHTHSNVSEDISCSGCVSASDLAPGGVMAQNLADGAVVTAALADFAVTTEKIADGAITSAKIAAGAVTGAQLADGSVTSAHLAAGAVSAAQLADGSVTGATLAVGSVTGAHVADGALTHEDILDGSLGTADYGDGSVTGAKLAGGAVNAAHIADGSVTAAELAEAAVDSARIADGSISGVDIAANAIGSDHVQDGAIGSGDLADQAITMPKMAPNSINSDAIADGAVHSGDLANDQISGDPHIANGSIGAPDIGDNQISGAPHIADGSIGAPDIGDNQITRAKLAPDAVPPPGQNLLFNAGFLNREGNVLPDGCSPNIAPSNIKYAAISEADWAALGVAGPPRHSVSLRADNDGTPGVIHVNRLIADADTLAGMQVTCSVYAKFADNVAGDAAADMHCFGGGAFVLVSLEDNGWKRLVATTTIDPAHPPMKLWGSGQNDGEVSAFIRYALPKIELGASASDWNGAVDQVSGENVEVRTNNFRVYDYGDGVFQEVLWLRREDNTNVGMELGSQANHGAVYIDFHHGENSGDFSARLVADAPGWLHLQGTASQPGIGGLAVDGSIHAGGELHAKPYYTDEICSTADVPGVLPMSPSKGICFLTEVVGSGEVYVENGEWKVKCGGWNTCCARCIGRP